MQAGSRGRQQVHQAVDGLARLADRVALQRLADGEEHHDHACFGVGADEDVLAVVQRGAVHLDAARPSTEGARGFKHGRGNAAVGKFNRGGHAGPARADDGDVGALGCVHGTTVTP